MTQTRDPHTVRTGLPGVLWLPALAALGLIVLPVIGLVVRAPWSRFGALITSPSALAALELSLRTAAVSTLLCVVLGGPLAVVLARGSVPGLRLLRSVVLLPLVLPPVVGGLALLYLLGVSGFAGYALDVAFGVRVPVHHHGGDPGADLRGDAVSGGPWKARYAPAGNATNRSRRRWARHPGQCSGESPCPWCYPGSDPARCSASPADSASSAPPSPSPAACRALPEPCRWRFTCSAKSTPTARSRCRCCWSWWPSW